MKPRIKKVNGLWWCNTELQAPVIGVTPDEAYRKWLERPDYNHVWVGRYKGA